MVKALSTFLILSATALALWYAELRPIPPCVEPMAYTIGGFDKRFDLTQAEFLSALKEAEAVWEAPSDRDLFSYNPEEAKLQVNLIYDYRQEATEELDAIETELRQDEAGYKMLESRYQVLKNEYESLKASYESRVATLEEMNTAYEARVENWNRGPRNDEKEFESLEEDRLAINAEVGRIKALESELNQKIRDLNQLVEKMNRMARELNLNVDQYNTIGATRGETFEGGVYYSDASGERINIYEFSSREKLVRVLAHELGHALGLEHISDPEAIMYHLNQGSASVATQADLAALEALCTQK